MMAVRAAPLVATLAFAAHVFAADSVAAHPFEVTYADVRFMDDGTFQVRITFHVDAMLAGVPTGDLSEEETQRLRALPPYEIDRRLEMVRRYFVTMVGLRFDGHAVEPTVSFPSREVGWRQDRPLPGHLVQLQARVPREARTFTFSAAPVFNLISLRIQGPDAHSQFEQVFSPLEQSRPYTLAALSRPPTGLSTAIDYGRLGFTHILPKGLDHILFVLGLYLLSAQLAPLLWQVTAFTAAHTLTLAFSMYGVVNVSAAIVEPLIALSIAYVAVENLLTSDLKPWRPLVVFGFGLLHGLGFAGVLGDIGLPHARFVTALLGFNVGIELGQLAVIALAFGVAGWFRSRPWYRARMVVPASAAIAATGCYWAAARLLG